MRNYSLLKVPLLIFKKKYIHKKETLLVLHSPPINYVELEKRNWRLPQAELYEVEKYSL